ncbi:hypothetical protein DPMN_111804, partial [Dreissena polymorpha]
QLYPSFYLNTSHNYQIKSRNNIERVRQYVLMIAERSQRLRHLILALEGHGSAPINYSTASFRTYFPLFLFRYEPTAKSSCSLKAGSRFVECVIRFLVTTNNHLLKELDVTRERHQQKGEID